MLKNGSLERLIEDADAILEGGDLSDVTSRHLLVLIMRQSYMKTKAQLDMLKEDIDTKIDAICEAHDENIEKLEQQQKRFEEMNEELLSGVNFVKKRVESLESDHIENPSLIKVFKESPVKVFQAILYLMGAGSIFWISDLRNSILDSLGLDYNVSVFIPLFLFGGGLLIEAYKKVQRGT